MLLNHEIVLKQYFINKNIYNFYICRKYSRPESLFIQQNSITMEDGTTCPNLTRGAKCKRKKGPKKTG